MEIYIFSDTNNFSIIKQIQSKYMYTVVHFGTQVVKHNTVTGFVLMWLSVVVSKYILVVIIK